MKCSAGMHLILPLVGLTAIPNFYKCNNVLFNTTITFSIGDFSILVEISKKEAVN